MPIIGSRLTGDTATVMVSGSVIAFSNLLGIACLLNLGKSFGILIAYRELKDNGLYGIVRHPMYVGLILAALGSLLIYSTWTTVYFACFAPLMFFRARREEAALSAEFGEAWIQYCKRVPAFFPRLRK